MGNCSSREAVVSYTNRIDDGNEATLLRELKPIPQLPPTDASRTLSHKREITSPTAAAFAKCFQRSNTGNDMVYRESVREETNESIHKKEPHEENRHVIPMLPDRNEDLLAYAEDEWSDLESLEYTDSECDTAHHEDDDDTMYSAFALDDFQCNSQARFTGVYDADILVR